MKYTLDAWYILTFLNQVQFSISQESPRCQTSESMQETSREQDRRDI